MLRIYIAAVLFLGAAMAHADDGMEKFLGEYTAKTVCDSHEITPEVEPHIRVNGDFIIAKYVNEDGKHRAVIVGKPGFSSYDWSDVEFEYVCGEEFPGIEISCTVAEGRDLRANIETWRFVLDGRNLTADEIENLSMTLADEGRETTGSCGWEHLTAEYDFHNMKKCRPENGKCHVVNIYTYGEDQLFIEYQARDGGIHAGHVHN